MKKLITTALLFAGLTMSAQDNFIAKLYDKFETSDTNYLDGVLFVQKVIWASLTRKIKKTQFLFGL